MFYNPLKPLEASLSPTRKKGYVVCKVAVMWDFKPTKNDVKTPLSHHYEMHPWDSKHGW